MSANVGRIIRGRIRSRLAGAGFAFASLFVGACSSDTPAGAPIGNANDAGVVNDAAEPSTNGPLNLAAGDVAEVELVEGNAAVKLVVNGGERFVVVVGSTKFDGPPKTFSYSLDVGTDTARDHAATGVKLVSGCAINTANHPPTPLNDPVPSGSAPTVGATRSLAIGVGGAAQTISVRAAAVGTRAVVWVDTTPAHPASLDDSVISEFLTDFEQTILPRARSVFGMESDLDGDGRIGLVFTSLTKSTAVAFFSGCDLLSALGCPASNNGEFLYLTPPGNIEPPYNTPSAIKEILAHELGHLVHFNRKVLKNKLSAWPDGTYMIEGFGGFAQDVFGYQAGNLYVTQAGLDGIDSFSLADVLNDAARIDNRRDGLLRGGSYLFVRYLYDRAGGDHAVVDGSIDNLGGPAFVRSLLENQVSVSKALEQATGSSAADIATDFFTALAISNADKNGGTGPSNSCFAFRSTETDPQTSKQRGADLFASFHGQSMHGPKMQTLSAADGKLRSGGVEYIVVDATAAQELPVALTIDPAAFPRVRIARLK